MLAFQRGKYDGRSLEIKDHLTEWVMVPQKSQAPKTGAQKRAKNLTPHKSPWRIGVWLNFTLREYAETVPSHFIMDRSEAPLK